MPASMILLSSWQPACAHVLSVAANSCSDVAWQRTHCSPWSVESFDSRCTLWPAEFLMSSHFSGSPSMWQPAHFSLLTFACAPRESGFSTIWVSAIWLRTTSVGWWQALHPNPRCALRAKRS